jgi:hypothetical protein
MTLHSTLLNIRHYPRDSLVSALTCQLCFCCCSDCSFGLRWEDVGTRKPSGTLLDNPALEHALAAKSLALDTCGVRWRELHGMSEIYNLKEADRIRDTWLERQLVENDRRDFRPGDLSDRFLSQILGPDSWVKVFKPHKVDDSTSSNGTSKIQKSETQTNAAVRRPRVTRGLKWNEIAFRPATGIQITNVALSTSLLVCTDSRLACCALSLCSRVLVPSFLTSR